MVSYDARATRAEELKIYREMRSALVPLLFQGDEKQRRGAAARLNRIDAKIRKLNGNGE